MIGSVPVPTFGIDCVGIDVHEGFVGVKAAGNSADAPTEASSDEGEGARTPRGTA